MKMSKADRNMLAKRGLEGAAAGKSLRVALLKLQQIALRKQKAAFAIIYHEIDRECISETDTVRMKTIKRILIEHGANKKDLD